LTVREYTRWYQLRKEQASKHLCLIQAKILFSIKVHHSFSI
jgi:hypothetical protein